MKVCRNCFKVHKLSKQVCDGCHKCFSKRVGLYPDSMVTARKFREKIEWGLLRKYYANPDNPEIFRDWADTSGEADPITQKKYQVGRIRRLLLHFNELS